jgi:hypothetical protein
LDKSKDDVKMKKNESMFGSKAYWMKKSGWKWRWEELEHVLVREEENSSTKFHHQNCLILALFVFFVVSVSLLLRGGRILPRACASAASFFVVAHSFVLGRDLPGNARLCSFCFFFFVCTRVVLDFCGMSGTLIRRRQARWCWLLTASKSCEMGRKVAHGFAQLVAPRSLAHLEF